MINSKRKVRCTMTRENLWKSYTEEEKKRIFEEGRFKN